jgi:hypothetical protein
MPSLHTIDLDGSLSNGVSVNNVIDFYGACKVIAESEVIAGWQCISREFNAGVPRYTTGSVN